VLWGMAGPSTNPSCYAKRVCCGIVQGVNAAAIVSALYRINSK